MFPLTFKVDAFNTILDRLVKWARKPSEVRLKTRTYGQRTRKRNFLSRPQNADTLENSRKMRKNVKIRNLGETVVGQSIQFQN